VAGSATLNFDIVEYCNDYFRLHYLNELGAMESMNFSKGNKHTSSIKRESYKSVVGGLTSASAYGYSKSDRSESIYNTVVKDNYKIRTDWLSEDYQNVLEQLVSSPIVYWEKDNELISISLKNTSFEFEKKKTKKMIMLELEFELSYDRYRQRY
jgi:hypothetical protein